MEYSRIAVDTSKQVFTLHGIDAGGQVVLRRDLTRARFEPFFAKWRRARWRWRRAEAHTIGAVGWARSGIGCD